MRVGSEGAGRRDVNDDVVVQISVSAAPPLLKSIAHTAIDPTLCTPAASFPHIDGGWVGFVRLQETCFTSWHHPFGSMSRSTRCSARSGRTRHEVREHATGQAERKLEHTAVVVHVRTQFGRRIATIVTLGPTPRLGNTSRHDTTAVLHTSLALTPTDVSGHSTTVLGTGTLLGARFGGLVGTRHLGHSNPQCSGCSLTQ